tara:strand:- start:47828 stop:48490 length:663 start_codon:yes stop_codon:yes gene_type:complete
MAAAKPTKTTKTAKRRKPTDTRSVSDKLIDGALDLAATHLWRDMSLAQIAEHAGIPLGDALMTLSGKAKVLKALNKRIDAEVLGGLEKDPLDGSIKDKLFDVLMRRFDALEGRQAAMASIVADVARDPMLVACLTPQFKKSMSLSLQAAGVTTDGWRGLIKIEALGIIYMNAFRVWLKDTDAGFAATMSALDKDLARAEKFAESIPNLKRRTETGEAEAA